MLTDAQINRQAFDNIAKINQEIAEAERLSNRRDEFLGCLDFSMLAPAEQAFISLRSKYDAEALNDLHLELHYHEATVCEPSESEILDHWNDALETALFEEHFMLCDEPQTSTEDNRYFHVMH